MMRVLVLLAMVSAASAILGIIGRDQSVAITGVLVCNGAGASNVRVKLYDDEVDGDSKMDEQYTNSQGQFRVNGTRSEITDIDPKVNVYHRCNYNGLCYQKFEINIPDEYVSSGTKAQRVYDIGTINLQNSFSGQSVDCLN